MIKHTTGPWKFFTKAGHLYIHSKSENYVIAEILLFEHHPNRKEIADARLIAAAPEMLEALETIVHSYETSKGCMQSALSSPIQDAKDAIDKAHT